MLSPSKKGTKKKHFRWENLRVKTNSELHMASGLHDEELQMEQTSQERGGPEWRQIELRRGWGGEARGGERGGGGSRRIVLKQSPNPFNW